MSETWALRMNGGRRGVIVLAAAAALSGFALAQPMRTFEVVSVKYAQNQSMRYSQGGGPGTGSPTRLFSHGDSLRNLVVWAYPKYWEKIRGPAWLDDRYILDAVLPAGTKAGEVQQMMAEMLRGYFRLSFHTEATEVPGFELVAVQGGARISVSKPVSLLKDGDVTTLPTVDREGFPVLPRNMIWRASTVEGYRRFSFHNASVDDIMDVLRLQLLRGRGLMVNKTGLTVDQKGDFHLEIALPESPGPANPDLAPAPLPQTYPEYPLDAVSKALEKAVGLRVRPARVATELMIIDHIDKIPVEP